MQGMRHRRYRTHRGDPQLSKARLSAPRRSDQLCADSRPGPRARPGSRCLCTTTDRRDPARLSLSRESDHRSQPSRGPRGRPAGQGTHDRFDNPPDATAHDRIGDGALPRKRDHARSLRHEWDASPRRMRWLSWTKRGGMVPSLPFFWSRIARREELIGRTVCSGRRHRSIPRSRSCQASRMRRMSGPRISDYVRGTALCRPTRA
jgi:hypothetical protein